MANVLSTQIIPYDFNIFVLVENPTANAGDVKRHGFNLWVGKIPWRRAWKLLQYSCLENPMDRGAWQATVHRVTKSWT